MGKIAFVFAGQGSQYKGMGKDIYENSFAGRQVFEMAEKINAGTQRLCFEADAAELTLTKNTQPAIFTVDLACAVSLTEAGINADCAAGFSLGEIPAAAFSGLMSYEQAFSFVQKRASLMQNATSEREGAMAAVLKLENEKVELICSEFKDMHPVNYNCKGQVSVAGATEEMDAFLKRVSEEGGRAIKLAVSGAFHCPFMESAYTGLNEYALEQEFCDSRIPLYSNVTSLPYKKENAAELISLQVKSPVLWEKTIVNMINDGVDTFIEVGPGKVLSGLIKKISPASAVYNVERYEDIQCLKTKLL